jgi:hypothetical protein
MDYYILDEVAGNPDIPYIGELPETLDMIDVVMGKKLAIKLPIRLPVSLEDESEVSFPDMMTADVPLFSEKLKLLLDGLEIDNIDFYPVELFKKNSGEIVARYHMGIILGLIKCLKSGLETSPAGRSMLKNPVIDPVCVCDQKLFRLYESPQLIIINSNIKDILVAAGLQGVSITKLEDYISI